MRRKDFFRNVITGFGGQLITVILGIIIPRIMISSYGSDVNGVVSTTSQIFTYLALLEAGIGQSARIALYKPITDKNDEQIAKVFTSAEAYFRRITILYAIGVVLISTVVPLFMKSEMQYVTIIMIFLLEGASGVISFYFIQTPTILLNADGKGFINNYVNLSNKILGYVSKIVLALFGVSIVLVQFAYFFITVLRVVFYRVYIRKKYSWSTHRVNPDTKMLKDKNSYLLTEIAWTIFSSTDMVVLSLFVSTKMSSVYSIYGMIYNSINLLINAVGGSVLYVLGQIYYRGLAEYEKVHDAMNTVFIGAMTILISVTYVLILPFVSIYTSGLTDVDYIYSKLPLLFSMIQLLSWSRYVNGNLTGLAGYAKQTSYVSMIEAMINLLLSIILVQKFGIYGVLFATVFALPIKVGWCAYISDKKVLNRSYIITLKTIGSNYLFFLCVVLFSHYYSLEIKSYGMFVFYGIVFSIIFGILGVLLNLLINNSFLIIAKRVIAKR